MDTVASILQSVAAVVVAVFAAVGFFLWRREMVGKRKMEVAERTLSLFYQIQDILEWARNPLAYNLDAFENDDAEKRFWKDSWEKDTFDLPVTGVVGANEVFAELKALRYTFISLFGKENERPFLTINTIKNQVKYAFSQFSNPGDGKVHSDAVTAKKLIIETMWSNSDNDPITKQIEEAVAQIEETCRPYLK